MMQRDELKIGQEISNQELMDLFAVGNMGGMRKSTTYNLLVLISDHTKELYDDRWQGDMLLYTGMGKLGDQVLKSQNKTVVESPKSGIPMHLFEVNVPTRYRYSGQVELAETPFQENQHDDFGKLRKVWIFPLRRVTASSPVFERVEPQLKASGEFDPKDICDGRDKVLAAIVRRRGQREFRNALLSAYERKCAITNCRVLELLDAAHIVPYKGRDTNHVQNGILLRTDLHTLFDLGMIAIDTSTWRVVISKRLLKSQYKGLGEMRLKLPTDQSKSPSKEALTLHRQNAGL